MIVKLSQAEYGKKMGVTQPAISYRISKNLPLPGVVKLEKMSRFYILHFETSTKKSARKVFLKKV